MPILGNSRDFPALQDWVRADRNYALECRNIARNILAESPSEANQAQFEESVLASNAADDGQEVWIAETSGEPKMRFAIGPRYMADGEYVTLDELISEGSYIIDSPNVDVELTSGEPFEAVLKELERMEFIKIEDHQIIVDSFVPEDEIQSVVTCALEKWDMSTDTFACALEQPEEERRGTGNET